MKSNNVIKTILLFSLFFSVGSISAQPGDPDEDPDAENALVDPAPIGDYVIPMMVLGVVTAFVLFKKKDLIVKKN